MTAMDLKKLNRKQLLELLLKQTLRVEELEAQVQDMEQSLEDKTLTQQEIGSIAEAALKLNGIFEAAEAAAVQYIENIKKLSENPETQENVMEFMLSKKNDSLLKEREEKCAQREAEAEKKIREANLRIAAANERIAEANNVIAEVKQMHESSKDSVTAVKQQVLQTAHETNDKPKDILDDFFSDIIGK